MEYTETYSKNSLSEFEGKLYGPFLLAVDYKFIKKNNIVRFIPISDIKHKEHLWASINDFEFFQEILKYGKDFYTILKNDIKAIPYSLNSPTIINDSYFQLVSENDITKRFKELEPICLDFLLKYGNPINIDKYFPQEYNFEIGYPVSLIINHSLLIYIIHTVFAQLKEGYAAYTTIYNSLNIAETDNNHQIYIKVVKYINMFSNPSYHLSTFNSEIVIDSSKTFVPISSTSNLFTFAFLALQNNIATKTFYAYDDANFRSTYICFKKCARCLTGFSEAKAIESLNKIPKIKTVYCEKCKIELKRIASKKYEKSLREKYNELKENIDKCSPESIEKLKELRKDGKISKKALEPIIKDYKKGSK